MAQIGSTVSEADVRLMVAGVINLVVAKDVADGLKNKLGSELEMIVDLLNGDVAEVDKGRILLGNLWFYLVVARWIAKRNGKHLPWLLTVVPDKLLPMGSFVSEPKLRVSMAVYCPTVEAPMVSVVAVKSHEQPKCPTDSSPSIHIAAHNNLPLAEAKRMAEVLKKVVATVKDIPKEKMSIATGHLETPLTGYKSTHGLTFIMKKIIDGIQLSSCLSSYAWPSSVENVLLRAWWMKYLQTASVTEANSAMKSKHFSKVLTILHNVNSALDKGLG